jgi:hypothetical protein
VQQFHGSLRPLNSHKSGGKLIKRQGECKKVIIETK